MATLVKIENALLAGLLTLFGVLTIVISIAGVLNILKYHSIEMNRASTVLIDVVTKTGLKSLGTGVILSDGRILTANHVVDDMAKITVSFFGDQDKKVDAKLLKQEKDHDLALISVGDLTKNKQGVRLNCQFPRVGSAVYTIGHSAKNYWSLFFGRVSVISYVTRTFEDEKISYAVNIGNLDGSSGGGLFSEQDGSLVGINREIFARPLDIPFFPDDDMYIPYQIGYPVAPTQICDFVLEK